MVWICFHFICWFHGRTKLIFNQYHYQKNLGKWRFKNSEIRNFTLGTIDLYSPSNKKLSLKLDGDSSYFDDFVFKKEETKWLIFYSSSWALIEGPLSIKRHERLGGRSEQHSPPREMSCLPTVYNYFCPY